MKRTMALISLAGVLAAAAMAHTSSLSKGDCKDCPIDNCPFCPHSK
jgi:hypothetical protein